MNTVPSEGILQVHTDWRAERFPEIERGWVEGRYGHPFRTCWFCGSIHPEDLVNWSPPNWRPNWADMKYGFPHKMYIEGLVNPDPEKLFILGSTNSMRDPRDENRGKLGWYKVDELTPELRAVAEAEGQLPPVEDNTPLSMRGDSRVQYIAFGKRNDLFAKFYTEHYKDPEISDEVKDEIMFRSDLYMEFRPPNEVFWVRYFEKYAGGRKFGTTTGGKDVSGGK